MKARGWRYLLLGIAIVYAGAMTLPREGTLLTAVLESLEDIGCYLTPNQPATYFLAYLLFSSHTPMAVWPVMACIGALCLPARSFARRSCIALNDDMV